MIHSLELIVQYPAADGDLTDYEEFVEKVHNAEALVAVGSDLMSLALLTPPGEWGADIVFGSQSEIWIAYGFWRSSCRILCYKSRNLKEHMPGRIIGISVDSNGKMALRMALQTREQHIKRERATSNICTAQALLATMSGMYAQYHGPEGLKRIAYHIFQSTCTLKSALEELGYKILNKQFLRYLIIELPNDVKADRY